MVFSTQVFNFFIKFIPKYFILLDAIVDGFFLISLSHSFWQSCVVYVCHNPSGVLISPLSMHIWVLIYGCLQTLSW